MYDNEALFGPIALNDNTIILVPRKTYEDRCDYVSTLSIETGIFIPNEGYVSALTLDKPPCIAGTLNSYQYYTINEHIYHNQFFLNCLYLHNITDQLN